MPPARERFRQLVQEAVAARQAVDSLSGRAKILRAGHSPDAAHLTAADWRAWEAARQRCDDAERALLDYVRRPI